MEDLVRPNADSRTKRDRIATELRHLVATGELSRGDRVRQQDLAEQFGTSITPVREALRLLEAEGLLVGEPHRGVRVASADINQVSGVYVARRLVEPYATSRALLRMSRRDISKARFLLEEMREAVDGGVPSEITVANRAFHFLIFSHCGLPGLVRIIQDLWAGFPWDILETLSSRGGASLQEHDALVNAIAAGDRMKTAAAAEEHVRNSYLALSTHLTGKAIDPFDDDEDADYVALTTQPR